jgi:hypothetical protein
LVHCSDGWDRSSQLISLSEILLDPYYRTIDGFIVLIEKEWLSFGHQFALRNGLGSNNSNEDQKAPIFLQWLDCVHQLITQFPKAFEFNMNFLLFLANHHNTCLFGTFLFNCEYERTEQKAIERYTSVWTDIYKNISSYLNLNYDSNFKEVLVPNCSFYRLKFWHEYFLSKFITPNINDDNKMLNDKLNDMTDVLNEIYSKVKDLDVFDTLSDRAKNLLNKFKK